MKSPEEWASQLIRIDEDDDEVTLYVCGVELNRYTDKETAERAAEYFRKAIGEKIAQAVKDAQAAHTVAR